MVDCGLDLEHGDFGMKSRPNSSGLSEQRAWSLALGTLFFALLSYWLVGISIAPSDETSEVGMVLRSILSSDAAWFVLLGWILTSSVYLGFSRWPAFFARYVQWPRASRTLAWQRFRSSLWMSLCVSLAWVCLVRQMGLLTVSFPGFDLGFVLSELHLVTDPLSSFILLFFVLDMIRTDLFAQAIKSRNAIVAALLVSVAVEVWVWSQYWNGDFDLTWLAPLILAVLWGALKTYEALLKGQSGAVWYRFGWALGIFLVFDLGLSLLDSPWSSGWSFYLAQVQDSVFLLACAALVFAAANVAVLHRFSKSLTRTD